MEEMNRRDRSAANDERLEQERRRYEAMLEELKETVGKLVEVVRLIEESPRHVTTSTDRESLVFWQNGERVFLSRGELDRLPDKLGQTNFAKFELWQLEEKLSDFQREEE
ncbi:MAG: hypothetical protein OXJ55_16615 [Caldilineaceae bacterium]|nr:hypothetical protein [Caldilineaceae bacterium]